MILKIRSSLPETDSFPIRLHGSWRDDSDLDQAGHVWQASNLVEKRSRVGIWWSGCLGICSVSNVVGGGMTMYE